jgi:hypothetical protein
MHFSNLNTYSLMTSKFLVLYISLRIAVCCRLISNLYKAGVLLTSLNKTSPKVRLQPSLDEQISLQRLQNMSLVPNPYAHHPRPWGTTRAETIFSRACRLYFLPICKDSGLNSNYNLLILYPSWLINVAFNTSQTQARVCLHCLGFYNVC